MRLFRQNMLIKHWNASGSVSIPLKIVLNAHLHVTSLYREKSTEKPNAKLFVSYRTHQSRLLSLDSSLHNRYSRLREKYTKGSLKLHWIKWQKKLHNHLVCCLVIKVFFTKLFSFKCIFILFETLGISTFWNEILSNRNVISSPVSTWFFLPFYTRERSL